MNEIIEEIKEKIAEIAVMRMMQLDTQVADRMEQLKNQYGKANVKKGVKASGFYVILKTYL